MNYKKQPKVRIKETGEVQTISTVITEAIEPNKCEYHPDEIEFITDEEEDSYEYEKGFEDGYVCAERTAQKLTKISPGTTTAHRIKMQSDVRVYDKEGGEELEREIEKVSDCCGAETHMLMGAASTYYAEHCKSCGEPCEAVEEHYCDGPDCPCQVPDDFDIKLDPIEPINKAYFSKKPGEMTVVEETLLALANKQAEIIERINLLQQHE